jgi:uncharacterized membrane protein
MKRLRPTFTGYVLMSLIIWNALIVYRGPFFEAPIFMFGIFLCLFVPGLLLTIAMGAKRLSLQTALYSAGLSILVVYHTGIVWREPAARYHGYPPDVRRTLGFMLHRLRMVAKASAEY